MPGILAFENKVANFYRFAPVEAPQALASSIENACIALGLLGSVLIASEGINGALAGPEAALNKVLQLLRAMPEFAQMSATFTAVRDGAAPFRRLRVRVREEIVTLGVQHIGGMQHTSGMQHRGGLQHSGHDGNDMLQGSAIPPRQWHAVLDQPDVLLIDVRNAYETALGGFPGAVDPRTNSFTEFRDFVREQLADEQTRPIAMYCTGGIRCTKAGAWMRSQGFTQVYELQGGVLGYLQSIAPEENRWQGNCFVFDDRVSVDRELRPGNERLCGSCGWPFMPDDTTPDSTEQPTQRRCPGCRAQRL